MSFSERALTRFISIFIHVVCNSFEYSPSIKKVTQKLCLVSFLLDIIIFYTIVVSGTQKIILQ